jgi:cell division protein ZapE
LISDIPSLTTEHPSLIVNWMHLVDVFYDAKLKLVLSAECRPARLYMAGTYLEAYARTQSRLFEMTHEHWSLQWRGMAAS